MLIITAAFHSDSPPLVLLGFIRHSFLPFSFDLSLCVCSLDALVCNIFFYSSCQHVVEALSNRLGLSNLSLSASVSVLSHFLPHLIRKIKEFLFAYCLFCPCCVLLYDRLVSISSILLFHVIKPSFVRKTAQLSFV